MLGVCTLKLNYLYKLAEKKNITIDFVRIHRPAFCVRINGGYHIAVNHNLKNAHSEQTVVLAYELGHCYTNSLYPLECDTKVKLQKQKCAETWAIETLIKKEELVFAGNLNIHTTKELASFFHVTVPFMKKVIAHYK